jgi:hypothetical protein
LKTARSEHTPAVVVQSAGQVNMGREQVNVGSLPTVAVA